MVLSQKNWLLFFNFGVMLDDDGRCIVMESMLINFKRHG